MSSPLILIVDDDRDTRELYKLVFDAGQYRVAEADSVAEGFRVAASLRPDVILTDWRLGDGDGFALCRALHRHGRTRHIPLVAATGVTLSSSAIAEARELGCELVLTKPIELDRLVRATAFALETPQRRLLRAAAARIRRFAGRAGHQAVVRRGDAAAARLLAAARLRERSQVALILADDHGRYVAANAHAVELTGYDSHELTSMSVYDLSAPGSAAHELWQQFVDTGIQEGVFMMRRRDGASIPARYVAVANVAPGLHLSALTAAVPISHPLL